MKVLLSAVSSSSTPDGVSRHAANVVRCLLLQPEIDHIDFVVGAWQSDSLQSLLGDVDERVSISIAHTTRSAWSRNRWSWSGLPDLARTFDSDIVHVSYPVPIRKAALSCPIVATLHDLYPYDIPENFGYPKVFINRLILRQCLQSVDRIACVSDTTAHRLEVHFPQFLHKALTIPNSVCDPPNAESYRPVSEVLGEPILLCVAQHRRNKNIPVAIHAFHALLKSRGLPAESRLLIVGADGPETTRITSLIERTGLRRNVILLRDLSEAEIHWCYANCDLLIAPSTVEGFGLPIVEAMLHRCRVVCSDIPAFREAAGSYCDYVSLSGDSVEAFAKAVHKALLSRRFRSAQTARFSSTLAGKGYLRLYRELLQSRTARLSPNHSGSTPALQRSKP
jgi:glycosyltransferase involved in cell wall biosynthesis